MAQIIRNPNYAALAGLSLGRELGGGLRDIGQAYSQQRTGESQMRGLQALLGERISPEQARGLVSAAPLLSSFSSAGGNALLNNLMGGALGSENIGGAYIAAGLNPTVANALASLPTSSERINLLRHYEEQGNLPTEPVRPVQREASPVSQINQFKSLRKMFQPLIGKYSRKKLEGQLGAAGIPPEYFDIILNKPNQLNKETALLLRSISGKEDESGIEEAKKYAKALGFEV